jgi:hypothetical protein
VTCDKFLIILIPQYFLNSILVQKIIFLFFSPWLRDERKRSLDSYSRERKMLLIPIYFTKINDIYVKWFHLMREVHIRCFFLSLKFIKNIYLSSGWFLISSWFQFLERFFFLKIIDRFITVLTMFWVKNGLKNRFLG